MRILHSVESYLPATQNWIYPQIVDVPNVEASVLCRVFVNSNEFPPEGLRFFQDVPFGASTSLSRRLIRAIARETKAARLVLLMRLARLHPMLIHAHFGTRGWEALWLKRALGIPLITTFYGVDACVFPLTIPIWSSRYVALFREGDLFLVEGPRMRQRLVQIGCPAEKIKVRHLGVDVNNLSFRMPEFAKGLRIAMVGRFVEKKGFADGLMACREVVRRGRSLELTVIGDAPSDDSVGQRIKRDLLTLAKTPELDGRVRFAGFLTPKDVHRELRSHNILLCPSRHALNGDAEGGMPFVLAEAMAIGIIGVGSNHCDMPELIVDGKTGFLFTEGKTDELVDVLCSIEKESMQLGEIVRAGREHVESRFNISRQTIVLGDIYRECLRRDCVPTDAHE